MEEIKSLIQKVQLSYQIIKLGKGEMGFWKENLMS